MKRFLLVSLLLLGTSVAASAQASLSNNPQAGAARVRSFRSNGAENSGFGIKGGLNFCNLVGGNAESLYKDKEMLTQYHVGAYAQIGVSNWFSIQPELLYQRKGFKGRELDASNNTLGKETVKLSYLSVPLLFVFNIFDNVGIQVGPQASYLLNVKEGSKQVDASSYNYNQFDVGVVGGVEAKIEFLRLGARYDYSLTDLRDKGQFDAATIRRQALSDIKNGVIQVYLGLGL